MTREYSAPRASIRVIGVDHDKHQFRGYGGAGWLAFEKYLLEYCQQEQIDLIAEELNDEAIIKRKAEDSVARHVARQLNVRHLFCDPDSGQRRALGIPSFREILAGLGPHPDIDLAEAKERDAWPLRERVWLDRLREIPFNACVMILGSQHVKSFQSFSRSDAWEVAVVERKWGKGKGAG